MSDESSAKTGGSYDLQFSEVQEFLKELATALTRDLGKCNYKGKDLSVHDRLSEIFDKRLGISKSELTTAQSLDIILEHMASIDSKLGETDGKKRSSLYELMCSLHNKMGVNSHEPTLFEYFQNIVNDLQAVRTGLEKHTKDIQNVSKSIKDLDEYAHPPKIYEYAKSTSSAVEKLPGHIDDLEKRFRKDISEMVEDFCRTVTKIGDKSNDAFERKVNTPLEANKQKISAQTDAIQKQTDEISDLKNKIDKQGEMISTLKETIAALNKAHADLDNSDLMKEYTDATAHVRQQKEELEETLHKITTGWQKTFDSLQQEQQKKLDEKIAELQRKIDEENDSLIELEEKKKNVERDLKTQYHQEFVKFTATKKELSELQKDQKEWAPKLQRLQEENRALKEKLQQHGITP